MSGGPAGRVGAIVLAAGRSARMGGPNKLLLPVDGVPMVRRVARTALDAGLDPVVVVTGHQARDVGEALRGLPVSVAHNPSYASGIASSLARGVVALPLVRAVVVALGDMPWVSKGHVEALVAAMPAEGPFVCVPVHEGRRGNPVLWSSEFFGALGGLTGDRGAKSLMTLQGDRVVEVAVEDDGVVRDVDHPGAFDP